MERDSALEDLREPLFDLQNAFSEALTKSTEIQSGHFSEPLDPYFRSHLIRALVLDGMQRMGHQMGRVANTGLEIVRADSRIKVLKADRRGLNNKALTPSRRSYCKTSEKLPVAGGEGPGDFWTEYEETAEADGKTHYMATWEEAGDLVILYLGEVSGVDPDTGRIRFLWRARVEDVYGGTSFHPAEEEIELFVDDDLAVSSNGW